MPDLKEKKSPEPADADPIRAKMDPEAQKAYDLMFPKHYILTATIFGIVAGSIVIFGGSGYLLDRYFETKPAFLIIGLLLGFAASQLTIYKKYSKL